MALWGHDTEDAWEAPHSSDQSYFTQREGRKSESEREWSLWMLDDDNCDPLVKQVTSKGSSETH